MVTFGGGGGKGLDSSAFRPGTRAELASGTLARHVRIKKEPGSDDSGPSDAEMADARPDGRRAADPGGMVRSGCNWASFPIDPPVEFGLYPGMRMLSHITFAALLALVWPVLALAQTEGLAGFTQAGGLLVEGDGWGAWRNTDELLTFLIDACATLALAATIAYHPVRRRAPITLASAGLPRLFYIYALVGMAVGFLVVNHGYVIGFVVFGIGALLRFRSNLDDPADTVEMILVTVLGLCVGMDLPIMAILIGVVSWVILLLVARHSVFQVTLKSDDSDALDRGISAIEEQARKDGWTVARIHKSHTKPSADVVLKKLGGFDEGQVEGRLSAELDALQVGWRVDG